MEKLIDEDGIKHAEEMYQTKKLYTHPVAKIITRLRACEDVARKVDELITNGWSVQARDLIREYFSMVDRVKGEGQ